MDWFREILLEIRDYVIDQRFISVSSDSHYAIRKSQKIILPPPEESILFNTSPELHIRSRQIMTTLHLPDELTLFVVIMLFPIIGLLAVFVLAFCEMRRIIFFKNAIPKYKHAFLHSQQREKNRILYLKTKIETVMDVEMPGFDKASDAWRAWSKEDVKGLKNFLKGDKQLGFGASYNVLCQLKKAERAMRLARNARRSFENVIEQMEEAKTDAKVGIRGSRKYDQLAKTERKVRKIIEKCETEALEEKLAAALVWGIYWPEQVEKAKLKKIKKSGFPPTQV
jgi:hypothetical protein